MKNLKWIRHELVLKTPFTVSYGSSAIRTAFILRGADGSLGEGTIPFYYGVDFNEMTDAWDRAAPLAFPISVDEISASIADAFPNSLPSPAAAALDIVYHDHLARELGLPIHALYGLPAPKPMTTSYTISIDTPEKMAEMALKIRDYPYLKVKLGAPGQEDLDEERIRAIRKARPEAKLRIDANAGWDADGAIRLIHRLEKYDLELVEQPTAKDDFTGMGKVQKATGLPIVADESVRTLEDIERLAEADVRGINVKLMKSGGIAPVLAMIRRAKDLGMGVMLGSMVETSVGVAAMTQLMGFADWIDLDTPLLIANDPFDGLRYTGNALLIPPSGLGLGLTIKDEFRSLFETEM